MDRREGGGKGINCSAHNNALFADLLLNIFCLIQLHTIYVCMFVHILYNVHEVALNYQKYRVSPNNVHISNKKETT